MLCWEIAVEAPNGQYVWRSGSKLVFACGRWGVGSASRLSRVMAEMVQLIRYCWSAGYLKPDPAIFNVF